VPSLVAHTEVAKLERELGVTDHRLEFLTGMDPVELARLRDLISHALFSRHETRFQTLAALTRAMPTAITAKVAEYALGAMLSARVANALDPNQAIRLANGLSPEFLTEVSRSLDPARSAKIITGLPRKLILDVGRRLLEQQEFLTLGRFVSVVTLEDALAVIEAATPSQVLQTALMTEDRSALDAIVRRLADDRVAEVVRTATASKSFDDALALLSVLSQESKDRLIRFALDQPAKRINGLIEAVLRNDAWADVLPSLTSLPDNVVHHVINVPTTLDPDVLSAMVQHARDLDLGAVLVPLVIGMDEDHLAILEKVPALRDTEIQQWIFRSAGVSERLVRAVLAELNLL
jgi:hypothetical protein